MVIMATLNLEEGTMVTKSYSTQHLLQHAKTQNEIWCNDLLSTDMALSMVYSMIQCTMSSSLSSHNSDERSTKLIRNTDIVI